MISDGLIGSSFLPQAYKKIEENKKVIKINIL